MMKRILALTLSLLLCMGTLPAGVYAEQPAAPAEPAKNEAEAKQEAAWYDQAGGWDDPDGGTDLGFNPYAFSVGEDMTVTAQVALQPGLMAAGSENRIATRAAVADPIPAEVSAAEIVNATCVSGGEALTATVRFLVDDPADIVYVEVYELTEEEPEDSFVTINGTYFAKGIGTESFDGSTMNLGTDGSGRTIIELTSVLYLGYNSVTPAGEQTLIAVEVVKQINGDYVSSPISAPIAVTVEGAEVTVPAPVLINATCVSDGESLSAKIRFLVDNPDDILCFEVFELTDQEPEEPIGIVNETLFIKSIMTEEFCNETMNRGVDASGKTIVELTSYLYRGGNELTEVGEQTLFAVQLLKLINDESVESPVSNGVTATVWPDELSQEQLQAFIPANLQITAQNSTYTLDVTVTWDNPQDAGLVEFYEVENGLALLVNNATQVYPFDGVVQSTIIQGDGTNPYEYTTVNLTNILRFSIPKYQDGMKQIDEELGVALCVKEGDTIQTALFACVGPNCQETEQRVATYVFEAPAPEPAPVVVNATCTSDGEALAAKVRLLVEDVSDIEEIEVFEVSGQELPEPLGTVGETLQIKSLMPVEFNNATMNLGPDGNGYTVLELTAYPMKRGGNPLTAVGAETMIAVRVIKRVNNDYVLSPVSDPVTVTVEQEPAVTVPAPILINATCVSDGEMLSARLRFVVEDTDDIADIEVYELTDQQPTDPIGMVNDTLYVKSIMTEPFYNETMVQGVDGSGRTIVELTSYLYRGENELTEPGEQTMIAVQVVKRINGKYISSPVSNGVTATVWPDELSEEQLQAFIPANLRITAVNYTNTLEVTVAWDNPQDAGLVEFYEVENGLALLVNNATQVYPFDGVVQDTIVPGDGSNPYEYQTVNMTNILRFSIPKYQDGMKQIDEELGVALCVKEGDTIQTALYACVGYNCQETARSVATYVFTAADPISLASNVTQVSLSPEQFTYSGEQNKPDVTVTCGGTRLTQGVDFDVSYGANADAGSGSVTIIGKGRYCDNATAVFDILPLSLNDGNVTVTLLSETCLYTGSPVQAGVSVTWKGKELTKGKDYDVGYSNNTAAGKNTAKVTVTGKGNFKDAVVKTFSIIEPELVLPGSLTVVEVEAFAHGAFSSVYVPASVTAISEKAFADCGNLSHIFFDTDQVDIADNAFANDTGVVFHCRRGSGAALFAQRKGFATEFFD